LRKQYNPTPRLMGAHNLLGNCGGAVSGERLLLCYETPHLKYYDQDIVDDIHSCALEMGLVVTLYELDFDPYIARLPPGLDHAMDESDLTIFLARAADQMRFSSFKMDKRTIISYALSGDSLASTFGSVNYAAMVSLKNVIDDVIFSAELLEISCPAGTAFNGSVRGPSNGGDANLLRFPMLVNTPAPADNFSGICALPGFLVGTGSKYYTPYGITFADQLLVHFQGNKLLSFEGSKADEQKADAHLDFISEKFSIERNFVHSWHLGIHPGCYFDKRATKNFESWSGSAFGNPRILHMHTCGAYAPGEICWNVVDPTVKADGINLWENGVLHPERAPGGADLLEEYADLKKIFENPDRRIGV
jgi:hypothetical protein